MSELQRTEQWFLDRLGCVTASRVNDVMARIKSGGESASRRNYRAQLVCERLTGKKEDSFCNSSMLHGIENEPNAIAAYEFFTGIEVSNVGFVRHPSIEFSGASPDGLVSDSGLIEVKCPNTATHIDWLQDGLPPIEHQNQMLWQMECTGRNWCDFVSYDPRLPPELQVFVVRFNRDEERIIELRSEVSKFLGEVSETVYQLKAISAKKSNLRIAA